MNKKKGKEFENIVKQIESKLNPNSTIESNVFLPDLLNPPHKRECDIVITETVGKRKNITIFEIQNRTSKVKIGDLTNFIEKKNAVGANRLIVVSKLPFSASVIDKAKKNGPAVELIQYSKIIDDNFDVGVRFINLKILDNPQIYIGSDGYSFSDNEKLEIIEMMNTNEECILFENKLTSTQGLLEKFKKLFIRFKPGVYPYEFRIDSKDGLKIRLKNNLYPFKVKISGEIEVESLAINEIYEYKLVEETNPFIYYSKGSIIIDGISTEVVITYTWIDELMCYEMSADFEHNCGIEFKYLGSVNKNEM